MEIWDRWRVTALAQGVREDLAELGRQVMRDYYQHGQDLEDPDRAWLGSNGEYMLRLCLSAPYTAYFELHEHHIACNFRDLDPSAEAFRLLVERVGSVNAAEDLLDQERATTLLLKEQYEHS